VEAVAYALPTRGTIVLAIEAERMVNMMVMSRECVRQWDDGAEVDDGRGSELRKGIGVEITRLSAHHDHETKLLHSHNTVVRRT